MLPRVSPRFTTYLRDFILFFVSFSCVAFNAADFVGTGTLAEFVFACACLLTVTAFAPLFRTFVAKTRTALPLLEPGPLRSTS